MNIIKSVAAFLIFTTIVSCSKTSSSNPVQDKLLGKWKNTVFVADSNGNHLRDAHDAVDSVKSQYIIEYYPDGTGAILLSNVSAGSFTWQLTNNNTYLRTVETGSPASIQHIDSLTSKIMILKDTSGISYTWQIFAKQ